MQVKDYYKTLEVEPVATQQEIKKSFRRLALKFHPDKNAGNPIAEAQFKEIQEAYEILSDPEQRKEYNYKRWHLRSIGQTYSERPLTPAAILEECRALKLYIDSMSIFRVDYDLVSQHIRQLVNASSIGILQQFNDAATNREIVQTLIQASRPLPLRYFLPISQFLLQLGSADPAVTDMVQSRIREKRIDEKWDIYKWVVMLIITTLLIWLMIEFGK
jgi:curved DNA-binding protein CbpA